MTDQTNKEFTEFEGKFSVNPRNLPQRLAKPWLFVQIYEPLRGPRTSEDYETSYRFIPACNEYFIRHKDGSLTGARHKKTMLLTAEDVKKHLKPNVKIAYKVRWLVKTGKRTWYIDYLPGLNVWRAEAECETKANLEYLRTHPNIWPSFITGDITAKDSSYTRSNAIRRTAKDIDRIWEEAKTLGCDQSYKPPEPDDKDIRLTKPQ